MVSGGYDGSRFDSTEVYGEDRVWKTVSGKLPIGISHFRATTISGNRVLIFGMIYQFNKILSLLLLTQILLRVKVQP